MHTRPLFYSFAILICALPAVAQVPFAGVLQLNSDAAVDTKFDIDQKAAIGVGNGVWIVVWRSFGEPGNPLGEDTDLFFTRSTNGGAAWSPVMALNTTAGAEDLNVFDDEPDIATDGAGNWVAVWESNNDLGDTIDGDRDILVALSDDDGETWSDPAALNTNADTDTPAQEGDWVPTVATDGGGTWIAAWETTDTQGGTIGGDRDLLFARSINNGATWSDPAVLNSTAASDVDDPQNSNFTLDEDVQIVSGGSDLWLAIWHSTLSLTKDTGTDADIFMAWSTNDGVSWSDPEPLNTNAHTDGDATDWFARAATDGAGNWMAIWQSFGDLAGTIGTDSDILASRSIDNGMTWSPPAPVNEYASTDAIIEPIIDGDILPDIATDGLGNWVAIWQSTHAFGGRFGTDWDILAARSIDIGLNWSYPAPVSTNAILNNGSDPQQLQGNWRPTIAADGAGDWLSAWQSADDLGNALADDWDILGATAALPMAVDTDGDTIPNDIEGTGDTDMDGTPNNEDTDSDGDTIPDEEEGTADPDHDSIPNYLDRDSDNDGMTDAEERAAGTDPYTPDLPSGCVAATIANRTPLAKMLPPLRSLRDGMATTGTGAAFVATYYAVSAPVALEMHANPERLRAIRIVILAGLLVLIIASCTTVTFFVRNHLKMFFALRRRILVDLF